MSDAPELPDSPLRALDDQIADPRAAIWRQRTLGVSIVLLCASPIGWLAGFVMSGWPPSPSYAVGMGFLVAVTPSFLLGLVGMQIALGYSRRGGAAAIFAILAALVAMARVPGHHWLSTAFPYDPFEVVYGVCGLVSDTTIIALAIVGRSRISRSATAVALVATAAPPASLIYTLLPAVARLPLLWGVVYGAVAGPIPVAGALALVWLLRIDPHGPQARQMREP